MDSPFMEHRWGTRVEMNVPAELKTTAGWSVAASVTNASISGAFVETREKLPLLSRVSVYLVGAAEELLDAWVVRLENTGMALEWLDPGSRTVPALLSLRHSSVMPASASHVMYPDSITWISVEQ